MSDVAAGDVPQRVKLLVNGDCVPEFPDECEPHTPHPSGYVQHSNWMDRMSRTHAQRQCKGCGLWAVWEPKGVTTSG